MSAQLTIVTHMVHLGVIEFIVYNIAFFRLLFTFRGVLHPSNVAYTL